MDTEKPSAELDAWLAEHVMGWRKTDNGIAHEYSGIIFTIGQLTSTSKVKCYRGEPYSFTFDPDRYGHTMTRWSPTTNLAHAWDLIERVLSLVNTEQDDLRGVNRVNRFYYALLQVGQGGLQFHAREKAALMICQAAYEAFHGD